MATFFFKNLIYLFHIKLPFNYNIRCFPQVKSLRKKNHLRWFSSSKITIKVILQFILLFSDGRYKELYLSYTHDRFRFPRFKINILYDNVWYLNKLMYEWTDEKNMQIFLTPTYVYPIVNLSLYRSSKVWIDDAHWITKRKTF